MSSSFIKSLKCFQCSKYFLIEEINFPEDVFELIRHYNLGENLFWMCDFCKPRSSKKTKNIVCADENPFSSVVTRPGLPGHWSWIPGKWFRRVDVLTPDGMNPKQPYLGDCSTMDDIDLAKPLASSHRKRFSRSSTSRSPSPPDTDRSARKYMSEIIKAITIPQEDKFKNKLLMNKVLDILINNMKKNEEFKGMMNRCYFAGSAYNNLKISSATEFDINLVLKVPKYVNLTPEFFDGNCAFVKLKWESSEGTDNSLTFFKENSDRNYLYPGKVLSWLQRHIDIILNQSLDLPNGVNEIKNSSSGPARTIVISSACGSDLTIDLVPVFQFEYTVLESTCFYDKIIEVTQDKNENNAFFVVPKQCTDGAHISVSEAKYCWRLDFPNAEKYILSEKECAKSVIKILKFFRDKKDWKAIASYYLKMVVILEILKNSSKEHWKNANIFPRTLDSFKQWAEYLKSGCLLHFLTHHNLFEKLNKDQRINWSNHLNREIESWESDPANLVKLIKD